MSHFEAIEALDAPERLPFIFDPVQDLAESYDRLCEEVDNGFITRDEANDLYNLMREQYGL